MEDNDEDDIDDGNGLGALLESAQKAAKEYDENPKRLLIWRYLTKM